MTKRMKISFGCYLISIFFLALFGIIYLFRSEFMPYHSVAVGISWDELDPSFQILILGLMKAVGGSCIAMVFMSLILLIIPFRHGVSWVRWAIPASGIVNTGGILYAMHFVGANTSANPPWIAPVLGVLLLLAGYFFSIGQPKPVEA